ncbi:alkaline phosphatase family protein [Paenibacillus sp. S150]|uniref:alkaline phosphatase family protein n=1 Tax=Paenibacillus sp. S150 TaxID=2749826 RepID=UPI001C58514B|nr:alkaline phosphatase family protein [Paenibacillus sp. S150]MBW4082406.1 alkaline phosphatase family protein [Paenibacillus sp. S150]
MTVPRNPVVWLIWDGAAAWAARRLRQEGTLQALEELASGGVEGEARVPSPNCQTPPSLATLFTGSWPRRHGIHGFHVPVSWLESRQGFDPDILLAEPIWNYAGAHGIDSVLVHIPWVLSDDNRQLPDSIRYAIEGYSKRIFRGGACVITPDQFGQAVNYTAGPYELLLQANADDSVTVLTDGSAPLVLYPASLEAPLQQYLTIGADQLYVEIFRRADGAVVFIHPGVWHPRTGFPKDAMNDPASTAEVQIPFVGEGLGGAYRRGLFGTRLAEGGQGEAERLLLHSIRWSAEYFSQSALSAIHQVQDAQLYILYQPCIDDVEHELMGWCDPQSKAYLPEIAEEVWGFVRQVYEWADGELAALQNQFGDGCSYIVSSDHGMAGMTHTIHVNEILAQARLLNFDAEGRIDPKHTLIVYHQANNGSLWLNPEIGFKAERDKILEKAVDALKLARHPSVQGPLFESVHPADSFQGDSGFTPDMGDLFVAAADGLELSAARSAGAQILVPTLKSASHATNPHRPSLNGIFYAKGPGIPAGIKLGDVDNRSVFPLICRQLGLEIPDTIEGVLPFG